VDRDAVLAVIPTFASLDTAVVAAHAAGDGARLAQLYGEAADDFASSGDIDTACFFYTQAYVHALEQGAPEAERYAKS
jgi:hypothetical protein